MSDDISYCTPSSHDIHRRDDDFVVSRRPCAHVLALCFLFLLWPFCIVVTDVEYIYVEAEKKSENVDPDFLLLLLLHYKNWSVSGS